MLLGEDNLAQALMRVKGLAQKRRKAYVWTTIWPGTRGRSLTGSSRISHAVPRSPRELLRPACTRHPFCAGVRSAQEPTPMRAAADSSGMSLVPESSGRGLGGREGAFRQAPGQRPGPIQAAPLDGPDHIWRYEFSSSVARSLYGRLWHSWG